jgi:hypothetical protein
MAGPCFADTIHHFAYRRFTSVSIHIFHTLETDLLICISLCLFQEHPIVIPEKVFDKPGKELPVFRRKPAYVNGRLFV